MSFLYFIVLIGVLVFVHELGHFLVARLFDVKVLRFALGFGPTIATYQRGETEYALCALPLGGYVQMLGGDLESIEELPDEERSRALMAKPIWQRSLIILAGPLANFILPIFIYFIFGMMQTTAPPAVVGQAYPEAPAAQAGIKAGDVIVEIDGNPVRFFHDVAHYTRPAYDQPLEIVYERNGERHTTTVTPARFEATDYLGLDQRTYGLIGMHLGTAGSTIALTDHDGPAARAGLAYFDHVIAVDDKPVQRFHELESLIQESDGKPVEIQALRRFPLHVDYGTFYKQRLITLTVTPELVDGAYDIGVTPSEMVIAQVDPDSPVAKAGLKPGDRILAVDDRKFSSWSLMVSHIHNTINQRIVDRDKAGENPPPLDSDFQISFLRDGEQLTTTLTTDVTSYQDQTEQVRYRIFNGWDSFRNSVDPENIPHPFFSRVAYSTSEAFSQTWKFTRMMTLGLVRLAEGRVSTKSIGGPIMIGELAAEAGRAGWEPFLEMMALISINLAILNLLPIPVLDGGQLLLFALEAIKRGPLSFRTRQIAAYIGFTMILMLMILAFKNDIERNWHRAVEYFESR
ncbi:RIP metalloprotease RseP [Lujinxingia vulgaris]|uniref:RIP metalloprotease RseP n=1 Tax=Lujinxingia vulgaris TaxID=2600176 RepID=A0A5C6XKL6_9DELT|nr:RIP metalloprotease RseP [Lujinxingia vulgaris]TXD38137.1 RIP metalloprotease RseP [Lujinxingia vulgaris]